MIAYNHYIDFIPELKNEKSMIGTFSNMITIKKSPFFDLNKELPYQKKYLNNQGRDVLLCSDMKFMRTQQGQTWAFEIEEVVRFFWRSGTKTLRYTELEKFTSRLLEYWALQMVLPTFFTIEETYDFLHAGAVEIDGKPILFIAESFGGKSTMTDFFLKKGHTMISDDKVACYKSSDNFFAVASHPHHRPHRKMEDLGFFVTNVAKIPKPMHAIYELDRAKSDASVGIVELHGIEKFKSLRYSSDINLSFQKSRRFVFLADLAKVVPVYKVTVPWDMERLSEVYDMIVKHSMM